MKDKERESQILKILLKNEENNSRVLLMTEGENELGTVALKIYERTLIIIDISLENDCDFENLNIEEDFFVDTLMRSAASYGETKGANFIETQDNKYNKILAKKGFTVDENHAFTKMSTIVHYT